MTWGFLWIMLALKIPLIALILIVWWAIRSKPEEPPSSDGDGGIRREHEHAHRPRPFPRNPRRGPHGGLPPASPARVRTVKARAGTLEH